MQVSAPAPSIHAAPFVFDDGAAYELMMGRWSTRVAQPFLDWLALPHGLDWLDDGCGDGSFTDVLVSRQHPARVVGVDPSQAQLAYARRRPGLAQVRFLVGDAQALPLASACMDAAVMALVLFFVPDPAQGVRELARVTRPGGTVAAYHWDVAGGGFPLQAIADALRAEGHPSQGPPSAWASSERASVELWRGAGLADVQTCRIEVSRRFGSFEEFWRTARGSPRVRDLLATAAPEQLHVLQARVRERLGVEGDGPVSVRARANAVKGTKPA